MTVAIRAEQLGKQYRLGNVTGSAPGFLAGVWRRRGRGRPSQEDSFWALRDATFDVTPGEVVGVIGRNGAGKSTLLKILSRLTEPTQGRALVTGRVGSLLEVGTGFHPELTGRENIFLNGTILGMKRGDVARRLDEIVAFAETERFLDTPVKRYSSGMYVRLAFAVAAHLEPDILLVDEVLAVGDLAFQRKCLGRIGEVAGEGRTILFVSHNAAAIKSLCSRALLLDGGRVTADGPSEEVVARYVDATWPVPADGVVPDSEARVGSGKALLRTVTIEDATGTRAERLHLDEPLRVRATYEVLEPLEDAVAEVGISTPDGVRVATVTSIDRGGRLFKLRHGRWVVEVEIDLPLLPHPQYVVDLALHSRAGATVDWVERVAEFAVLNLSREGTDHFPWSSVRGYVRPPARWSARQVKP